MAKADGRLNIKSLSMQGQKFLVTGASAGIGEALVEKIIEQGGCVWALARRLDRLEALKRRYPEGSFNYSVCDVAQARHIADAWQSMRKAQYLADVAILNAGVNAYDLIPQFNYAKFKELYNVNLFGALGWVDILLPEFLKRGYGHFVAVSSMSAFLRTPKGAGYASSKAALSSAFACLRSRYHKDNIAFTTAHLGPVATAMWPGGKFPLLLSPTAAAVKILKAINKKQALLDTPWPLIMAARLTQFIPDNFLMNLVSLIKRK